ncbi:MAG TPA: hypothetical protein VEV43_13010 [Actinomycetota bacterium]|nr:hypothetical protein [Actinomycetota bacterium]
MLRKLTGRVVAGLAAVARAVAGVLDGWARRWGGPEHPAGGPPADWAARVRAKAPWLLEPEAEDVLRHELPPPFGPAGRPSAATAGEPARPGRLRSSLAAAPRPAVQEAAIEPDAPARPRPPVPAIVTRARARVADGITLTTKVVAAVRAEVERTPARDGRRRDAEPPAPDAPPPRPDADVVPDEPAPEPPEKKAAPPGRVGFATRPRRSAIETTRERRAAAFPRLADAFAMHPSGKASPSSVPASLEPRWVQAFEPEETAVTAEIGIAAGWPDVPDDPSVAPAATLHDDEGSWPELPPGISDDEDVPQQALLERDRRASLDSELRSL